MQCTAILEQRSERFSVFALENREFCTMEKISRLLALTDFRNFRRGSHSCERDLLHHVRCRSDLRCRDFRRNARDPRHDRVQRRSDYWLPRSFHQAVPLLHHPLCRALRRTAGFRLSLKPAARRRRSRRR